jgi:hypothetical protein
MKGKFSVKIQNIKTKLVALFHIGRSWVQILDKGLAILTKISCVFLSHPR